ncbi:MAG: hypothetical protein Q9160_005300 [Pyrenula sp. 1 TL-2023]
MQFCTSHAKDLENAFASLSLDGEASASTDPASNPATRRPRPPTTPLAPGTSRPLTPSPPKRTASSPTRLPSTSTPLPSSELSTILLALRKLREALLASSTSPLFSQRVHVFSIRLSILALHPPSYYPSLLHLLFTLHRPHHPLPTSELSELTTYLILDLACRQREFATAYALRAHSRSLFAYQNRNVDAVLDAVVRDNWVAFWRVRRKVDGYTRAVMGWAMEPMRRTALKAIGRSYLACPVGWVLESTSGGEMEWEELVRRENVGWIREGEGGERVVIRKIKPKEAGAAAAGGTEGGGGGGEEAAVAASEKSVTTGKS